MSNIAIGIDLGTTNSCIAYYRNGELKILENEEGQRVTPSFVFFTEVDEVVVGEYALRQSIPKPECGIHGIKRLVGRKFDDPHLQENLKYYQYEVSNDANECVVTIRQKAKTIQKTPQQLCAIILTKLKKDAESKVGGKITKAVITVPAYFNMRQREITLAAAQEAGFTVLKLLNEPTAAALNYYFDHGVNEENCILVYDLGGGTFDVSIVKGNAENINILGVDGDTYLGGNDFDVLIENCILNELQKRYKFNPKNDRRLMRRLLNKSQDAKIMLSGSKRTTVEFEGFVPNEVYVDIELTREQFEEMACDLFRRTMDIVENCLKSCNLKTSDIDHIILSGGSTRIPKIQEMLSAFFGKEPNKVINPDECVGAGAALQAAMLSTNPYQKIDNMNITDVTPLSLGIKAQAKRMKIFIKRNTPIPVSNTINFCSAENRQTSMRFDIYEGERTDVRKNRHLASVSINDLAPAPPCQCQVEVTMSLDLNGILTVKAKDKLRNNVKELTVVYTRGCRSDSEVKNALRDAAENKEEDEKFITFAYAKEYLIQYCEGAVYNLEQNKLIEKHKEVYDLCKETKSSAELLEADHKSRIDKLIEHVEEKCQPLVKQYNFNYMPILRT